MILGFSPINQKVGYVSYWGDDIKAYDTIVSGSLAIINPDSGIFASKKQGKNLAANIDNYQQIVQRAKTRDISILGYVPTGYFNHKCNEFGKCQKFDRIEAQIEAYFAKLPEIDGIFFDEAAPSNWDCESFINEYEALRKLVHKFRSKTIIAFNAGVADNCVANAIREDEIAVLFESSFEDYKKNEKNLIESSKTAHDKNAKVWHLVHSAPTNEDIIQVAKFSQKYGADYIYVSRRSGDWKSGVNTWGN